MMHISHEALVLKHLKQWPCENDLEVFLPQETQ